MKGTCEKILLIGYLGKDPEVRSTTKGVSIVTLSMAIHRTVQDQNGEYHDVAEWRFVKLFGHPADFAKKYAKKGMRVMVEPVGHTMRWKDKITGKDQFRIDYISPTFELMSPPVKQNEPVVENPRTSDADDFENAFAAPQDLQRAA